MEMLFVDCINDEANYILIFKIILKQHVNNSSLYIDELYRCVCASHISAYLVVIQPQLLQQHIYANR